MKKLNEETKVKLIYSGELLIFAIIFGVLGTLKMTGGMSYNNTRRIVFNWITIFGGTWGITDFIWAICSKRRQQRISLFDKFTTLPLSLYIISYDIVCFATPKHPDSFYNIMLGAAFVYVAVIYLAQSIYHWYRPIPGLFDDKEESSKTEEVKQEEVIEKVEETTQK